MLLLEKPHPKIWWKDENAAKINGQGVPCPALAGAHYVALGESPGGPEALDSHAGAARALCQVRRWAEAQCLQQGAAQRQEGQMLMLYPLGKPWLSLCFPLAVRSRNQPLCTFPPSAVSPRASGGILPWVFSAPAFKNACNLERFPNTHGRKPGDGQMKI